MMALVVPFALAHVPTFDDVCFQNCCELPHAHTTSQVAYLKIDPNDRGGIEVHLHNEHVPFAVGELIDIDLTFRDAIDASTVVATIGCGGCARGDPLLGMRQPLALQPPEYEPFTSTTYRSGWKGDLGSAEKRFNSSLLHDCPAKHFTIRVDVLDNASGPVFVGAVLGKEERFTLMEFASFGDFQLRLRGATWTDMGWTLPLNLVLAVLAIAAAKRTAFHGALARAGLQAADGVNLAVVRASVLDATGVVRFAYDPRELLYDVAIHFWVVAVLDNVAHFFIAAGVEGIHMTAWSVGVFWFGIVLVANVLPAGIVLAAWSYMFAEDRTDGLVRADVWAPIEIVLALLFAITLGSGFGVSPFAWLLAGIVRLRETELFGRLLRTPAGLPPTAAAAMDQAGRVVVGEAVEKL